MIAQILFGAAVAFAAQRYGYEGFTKRWWAFVMPPLIVYSIVDAFLLLR